jgi:hypothetical protein
MTFVGLDNGTSSNGIGVVTVHGDARLYKLPVRKQLSYTKEVKTITRIDFKQMCLIFDQIKVDFPGPVFVGLERPMVNSTRFNASLSAIRCLEATLIALEETSLRYEYIDSKEWQKVLLPKGIKGSDLLKQASLDVGKRLFPNLDIKKDADSLLIAEYMRRRENKQLTN